MDRIELRSSHLCEDCFVGISNTVGQYSFPRDGELDFWVLGRVPHLVLVTVLGGGKRHESHFIEEKLKFRKVSLLSLFFPFLMALGRCGMDKTQGLISKWERRNEIVGFPSWGAERRSQSLPHIHSEFCTGQFAVVMASRSG